MNNYEKLYEALGASAKYDPTIAMMIEACVKFTADSFVDSDTEAYFKREYGERVYRMIIGMIEYM